MGVAGDVAADVPTSQYNFVREKAAISELLRVMFMTQPNKLVKWHTSNDDPFSAFFLLLDTNVEVVRLDALKLLCMLFEQNTKYKTAFTKIKGFDIMVALLSRRGRLSLACAETLLRFSVGLYKCDSNSQLADKKLGGEEDQIDYSRFILVHPEAVYVVLRLLSETPMPPTAGAGQGGSALHVHVIQQVQLIISLLRLPCSVFYRLMSYFLALQLDLLCEKVENIDRLLQESDWWRESRYYLLAIRFHGPVPDSVLDGQWEASMVSFFEPDLLCFHEAIRSLACHFQFLSDFQATAPSGPATDGAPSSATQSFSMAYNFAAGSSVASLLAPLLGLYTVT